MDWIKRLNLAIEFIEENLDGELDYEDVAGIAGCPSYYFQQMFLYMTDMTLREYIGCPLRLWSCKKAIGR